MFYYEEGDWLFILLAVVVVAAFGLLLNAELENKKTWERFKAEHQCRIVARISGDVFNTVGSDSKGGVSVGIAATPDKTGWACNDGVTYYR